MDRSDLPLFAVLTTIQLPTPSVVALRNKLASHGARLIVVGDRKGPVRYDLPGIDFLPLSEQQRMPFRLAAALPTGHYSRKNLGYLRAIADGAGCIYETDDDNAPNAHWHVRSETIAAGTSAPGRWVNVYRFFTDQVIWPRGLPLERIHDPVARAAEDAQLCPAPLQQGLADRAPDVDAVWRLVFPQEFFFESRPAIRLPPGCWCPFNSQSTWWWPVVFPLLYLPSGCSFRMTDIWRSLIAQRCLWELEAGVVFHGPEVIQERNEHSLQRDFEHEIPGYLQNDAIVELLEELPLRAGAAEVPANLIRCYECLVDAAVFPRSELMLVRHWMDDVESACRQRVLVMRAGDSGTERHIRKAA